MEIPLFNTTETSGLPQHSSKSLHYWGISLFIPLRYHSVRGWGLCIRIQTYNEDIVAEYSAIKMIQINFSIHMHPIVASRLDWGAHNCSSCMSPSVRHRLLRETDRPTDGRWPCNVRVFGVPPTDTRTTKRGRQKRSRFALNGRHDTSDRHVEFKDDPNQFNVAVERE